MLAGAIRLVGPYDRRGGGAVASCGRISRRSWKPRHPVGRGLSAGRQIWVEHIGRQSSLPSTLDTIRGVVGRRSGASSRDVFPASEIRAGESEASIAETANSV